MAWDTTKRQDCRRLGRSGAGVALFLIAALAMMSAMLPPTAGGADRSGPLPEAAQARSQAADKRDPLAVELEERLADDVRPLLSKYCYDCHGNGKKKGGVKLDGPGDIKSIMHMADDWLTVVEVINAGLMPPDDQPQPSAHEIQTIQQWVEEAADYYPADAEPDPGWYTIHRLNKSEYRNTLRDLLGIDPAVHDLTADLPADDSGYGFDNIADVLSMSPLQLESYLDAAERAVDLALRHGSPDGVKLDASSSGPISVRRWMAAATGCGRTAACGAGTTLKNRGCTNWRLRYRATSPTAPARGSRWRSMARW